MSRTYGLWDVASRNLIGGYASEAEALTFVRAYVAERGAGYPSSWALLWDDDDADRAGQIAEGQALLLHAERSDSTGTASTESAHQRAR